MNKINKIGKDDFSVIKKKKLSEKNDWIRVGMSTCGIAAGAGKVMETLKKEIEKRNLGVSLKMCGCAGMCYAEPLVEVCVEGLPCVTYGRVNPEFAANIVERHIVNKQLLQDHIYQIKAK